MKKTKKLLIVTAFVTLAFALSSTFTSCSADSNLEQDDNLEESFSANEIDSPARYISKSFGFSNSHKGTKH